MELMLIALQNMLRKFVVLSIDNSGGKVGYAKQDQIVDRITDQCVQISKLNDADPASSGSDEALAKVTYAQQMMGKSNSWRLKPAVMALGMQFTEPESESVVTAEEVAALVLKGLNKKQVDWLIKGGAFAPLFLYRRYSRNYVYKRV